MGLSLLVQPCLTVMAFEVILKKNIKIKKKNLVVSYGKMEFYWREPQSHANCRMETFLMEEFLG